MTTSTATPQLVDVTEIYEKLGPAFEAEEICAQIINHYIDELGAFAGHIRLIDHKTNELVFVAGVGPYQYFAPKRKKVGADITGKIVKTGDPYLASDLDDEAHFQRMKDAFRLIRQRNEAYKNYLETVTSEIIIPLEFDDKVFGLATAQGIGPHHFSEEELASFTQCMHEAIADLAVYNVHKTDLAKLIVFALDLETAFKKQVQHSIDILEAYSGHVRLYDSKHEDIVYYTGQTPLEHFTLKKRRKKVGSDIFSSVINTSNPFVIPDLDLDPHFRKLREKYKNKEIPEKREFEEFLKVSSSEVVIPLKAEDIVVGCCALKSEEIDFFSSKNKRKRDDFKNLMNQIADRIAAFAKEEDVSIKDVVDFCINFRGSLRKGLQNYLDKVEDGGAYGTVMSIDKGSGHVVLVACVGPYENYGAKKISIIENIVYKEIVYTRQARHIPDLCEAEHFLAIKEDFGELSKRCEEYNNYLRLVRSEFAVPLKVESRIIGTATLQSDVHNFFDDEKRKIFRDSMRFAAIMIENAQNNQKMEQLQGEINNMTNPHELEQVLKDLSRTSIEILGADVVAIFQYDTETEEFAMPPVIDGVLIRPDYALKEIKGGYIPEIMVRKRIDYFSNDVQDIPRDLDAPELEGIMHYKKGFVNRERIASAAGLLLEIQGEIVGVMFLNFRQPQVFYEIRKGLMRILASQAALAIRNARLFKSSEEERRKIDMLWKIQTKLVEEFDLKTDLNLILQEALHLFGADSGHIRRYDSSRNVLIMETGVGRYHEIARQEIGPGESVSSLLIDDPNPIIVADVGATGYRRPEEVEQLKTDNPPLYDFLQNEKSFVCLPLLDIGELIGTICLSSTVKNTFSEADRESLKDYRRMAMVIIRNARRHQRAKEQIDKLERLSEATLMMQENISIKKKIAIILTAITVRGGLEFNRAMLFLAPKNGKEILSCHYAIGPSDQDEAMEIFENPLWEELVRTHMKDLLREMDRRFGLDTSITRCSWFSKEKPVTVSLDDQGQCLVEVFHQREVTRRTRADLSPDDLLLDLNVGEFALAPLVVGGRAIGVLYVDNRYNAKQIDDEDLFLLKLFADQAATAIQGGRQYQEEIHSREQKALQLTSQMVAHRLRNVLPVISDRIHRTLERGLVTGKGSAWCRVALEETRRAQMIVRDFETFSRTELFERPHRLSGGDLLKKLRAVIKQNLTQSGARVDVKGQAGLPDVLVNLDRLSEDFAAFVRDSERHKEFGLSIKLSAEQASEEDLQRVGLRPAGLFLKLVYADNGPGIPEHQKFDIFEPFFTTTGGSGLGLTIALHNANVHGGTLVECGRTGKGVRFEFYLPADQSIQDEASL